jgi:hypothetical protein
VSAGRHQPVSLPLGLLVLVWASLLALGGGDQWLLHLLPLLLVVLPLLFGRFPGERALARSAARPAPRPEARRGGFSLRRGAVLPARGGRLIAYGLARRGPPHPRLVCHVSFF